MLVINGSAMVLWWL